MLRSANVLWLPLYPSGNNSVVVIIRSSEWSPVNVTVQLGSLKAGLPKQQLQLCKIRMTNLYGMDVGFSKGLDLRDRIVCARCTGMVGGIRGPLILIIPLYQALLSAKRYEQVKGKRTFGHQMLSKRAKK